MIFVTIYIVGFILTLTFFKFFGKKIGMDYDPPHCVGYDDYESNAHAYLTFSLGWFLVMPTLLIGAIVVPIIMFTKWFLRL